MFGLSPGNPNRSFGDHPGIILGHGSFCWQGLGGCKEGMNIPSEETGIVSKNVLILRVSGVLDAGSMEDTTKRVFCGVGE